MTSGDILLEKGESARTRRAISCNRKAYGNQGDGDVWQIFEWARDYLNVISAFGSGLGAAASGYYARKAHARRKPIIETSVRANEPWQGWHSITITVTNQAPARLQVEAVSVPWRRRGKILPPGAAKVTRNVPSRHGHWGWQQETTKTELPEAPPQIEGLRSITLEAPFTVTADTSKPYRFHLLSPPTAKGACGLPTELKIAYRWLDRRGKQRTQCAAT